MVTAMSFDAPVHGLGRGLHHVAAAGRMHIDDRRDRIERHQAAQCRGDGIGNVVELEIEEDRQARLGNRLVAGAPVRVEEFEPDLEITDMGLERCGKRLGAADIGRVEGNADRDWERS